MTKVFIDGSAGTTGLRIADRLSQRQDITLIRLTEEKRKDAAARKGALNECDIAFLCLPDAAAIEAAAMVENPDVVVLDASTAHRTDPGWAYGFPELSAEMLAAVKASHRIAVPGCHASGFVSLIYPLVAAGVLPKSALVTCHSLTGYSGGGKSMIAEYEASGRNTLLDAPRQYGLTQKHKHLKEMQAVPGLDAAPVFSPIVAPFYSGMEVTVPLFRQQLTPGMGAENIKEIYSALYAGSIVKYRDGADEGGFFSAGRLSGLDRMEVSVLGNDERILLVSRFDNLGKGASGAAVECMNIVLGLDPATGLELGE